MFAAIGELRTGKTIVVQQVGCERDVPEGAVRNRGGRVRLAAQSIEAETGARPRADRYDGSLEGVKEFYSGARRAFGRRSVMAG